LPTIRNVPKKANNRQKYPAFAGSRQIILAKKSATVKMFCHFVEYINGGIVFKNTQHKL